LGSYYRDASDPYIGTIPASGAISFTNFYSSSRRTARLYSGTGNSYYSNGVFGRKIGWSVANGSQFWHYEFGYTNNAFGFSTRSANISTTAPLGGIHTVYYGNHRHLTISHASSSNSGWSFLDFKVPLTPGSSSLTTITIQRGAPNGGVYRGFRRNFGSSAQQQYYSWSWSWESWQWNDLARIASGLINSWNYGSNWYIRMRT
jgi:hypothetical protein